MDDAKRAAVDLARAYAERGDPDGWFEEFYESAGGDIEKVYWADMAPNRCLVSYLEENSLVESRLEKGTPATAPRAIVVACGLGDDAELLASHGYRVTAFDISAAAVAMCRARYPESAVDYLVADLFAPPRDWPRGFDLVFECNTIQILTGDMRARALEAIAELVAPGGVVLVSCRSRETGEKASDFPVPLDREEIDGFRRAGLVEEIFTAHDDEQDPPVPHFFATYRRP